ncbi:MAG: AAA family ATPase [Candidatus Gracilibacteria bacterium]|jgi:dephospho-CoA kinase
MIIGLTGSMGCGKGEVVKILENEGFKYVTLSMMVREEARKRGIPEEREKLMEVGNSMRKDGGAGVLAKRALETILASDSSKWVIDGIRNPAEIDELKKSEGVYIVGIKTDLDLLVDRIISRNRESDAKIPAGGAGMTEAEYILRKVKREWGEGEPEDGQQVGKCMEKVDVLIDNNGTLEDLNRKFTEYYSEIAK